jgi:CheY-like chemotaxis protein
MTTTSGKLFLVHWNHLEAQKYARTLIESGWDVLFEAEDGGRAYQTIKSSSPAVIVIYLTRLPSHGRETAHAIRTNKSIREIPIIFVGGQGEALEKTQAKIPEAIFLAETELMDHLERLAVA